MGVSSFLSSFLPVIHGDAPGDQAASKEQAEQNDTPEETVNEEEEEEPQDVCL